MKVSRIFLTAPRNLGRSMSSYEWPPSAALRAVISRGGV